MKKLLLKISLVVALISIYCNCGFAQHSESISLNDLVTHKENNTWKSYSVDGFSISINISKIRQYGRYYVVALYLQNNTEDELNFNFSEASLHIDEQSRSVLLSKEKYNRRVHRRRNLRRVGVGVASVATAVTMAAIMNGRYDERDHSIGRDILQDLSNIAVQEAIYIGTSAAMSKIDNRAIQVMNNNIGYLKSYNVDSHTSISGFAYARFQNAQYKIEINIPINGKIYNFVWDPATIQTIQSES